MAKSVYFISDAHLGLDSRAIEREKETRLIAFLDEVKDKCSQLFILGDLFDTWIEYRTVIPKGFHRLLAKIDELTHRGIIVHYLAGNHDFWTRDYFRDELGVITYSREFEATIDGKKIYFHHGDGLAKDDTGYKILKKLLRSDINIWLYSWVHPDLGLALARSSSKKSRRHTSDKRYGEEDGMLQFAKKKMSEGFDIVIMGHRHQPVSQPIGSGMYINLGDWITHNTYAMLHDGTIELLFWNKG